MFLGVKIRICVQRSNLNSRSIMIASNRNLSPLSVKNSSSSVPKASLSLALSSSGAIYSILGGRAASSICGAAFWLLFARRLAFRRGRASAKFSRRAPPIYTRVFFGTQLPRFCDSNICGFFTSFSPSCSLRGALCPENELCH